jgi:hypothetical protein
MSSPVRLCFDRTHDPPFGGSCLGEIVPLLGARRSDGARPLPAHDCRFVRLVLKVIIGGRGDDLVDLARTNLGQ